MTTIRNSDMAERNEGIALLRPILTFSVIMVHFWNSNNKMLSNVLNDFISLSVPVFMLISFFLTESVFSFLSKEKFIRRIRRLGWPYVFWGGANWVALIVTEKIFNMEIIDGFHSLFWQILTGHAYHVNTPLWYIAVLLWISLFFFAIFSIFKRKAVIIIHVIGSCALILQYSCLNYLLFNNCIFELRYPLGRIAEMFPYAVLGYDLSYFNFFDWIKLSEIRCIKFKYGTLCLFIILVFFCRDYHVSGFGYAGFFKIIKALSLLAFFYLLDFKKFPKKIMVILHVLEAHTLGVYCLHYVVGNVLLVIIGKNRVSLNQYVLCILIYLVCFLFAKAISRIPIKAVQNLVD